VSEPGASPLRSALRRLGGYIGRNRGYYAIWLATTLTYVAGFVAIPLLVGRSLSLVADGAAAAEVTRSIMWLTAVTIASGAVRFYSRTLVFNAAREIEYEIRNDIFSHLQRFGEPATS